jgi:hypothetical protein
MSNTTPSYNLKQQKQSSSFQSFSINCFLLVGLREAILDFSDQFEMATILIKYGHTITKM